VGQCRYGCVPQLRQEVVEARDQAAQARDDFFCLVVLVPLLAVLTRRTR
jgi:hypothetical protein